MDALSLLCLLQVLLPVLLAPAAGPESCDPHMPRLGVLGHRTIHRERRPQRVSVNGWFRHMPPTSNCAGNCLGSGPLAEAGSLRLLLALTFACVPSVCTQAQGPGCIPRHAHVRFAGLAGAGQVVTALALVVAGWRGCSRGRLRRCAAGYSCAAVLCGDVHTYGAY